MSWRREKPLTLESGEQMAREHVAAARDLVECTGDREAWRLALNEAVIVRASCLRLRAAARRVRAGEQL